MALLYGLPNPWMAGKIKISGGAVGCVLDLGETGAVLGAKAFEAFAECRDLLRRNVVVLGDIANAQCGGG